MGGGPPSPAAVSLTQAWGINQTLGSLYLPFQRHLYPAQGGVQ